MGNLFRKPINRSDLEELRSKLYLEFSVLYQNKDDELTKKNQIIHDLEKEISSLKELVNKRESIPLEIKNREINTISNEKINEVVEKILNDANVNISYLPDWVERKLYMNVITIIMNLLNNTLETTSISLLGHKIEFVMKPDEIKQ